MKIRVVQIWGFLMTVLGWIFVACTMAMEGWKIASVGGMGGSAVIKRAWHWTSLWRSCFTDSTAVTNCYDFPVLWAVDGYVQIVRALLMSALAVGMLGFVLSLLGMECTYIGGRVRSKYKKIFTGGWCHIMSGVLSTSGYGVYAQYVSAIHTDPGPTGLQFNLGTPVFLGLVGSAFHITGGAFYLWSVCMPLCGEENMAIVKGLQDPKQNKSTTSLSTMSEITSKSKLSSISGLSSRSEASDLSSISSRPSRPTAKSGHLTKTGRTTQLERSERFESKTDLGSRSGSGSPFGLSSRSSQSQSRSSRTPSLASVTLRSEIAPFVKNSYI